MKLKPRLFPCPAQTLPDAPQYAKEDVPKEEDEEQAAAVDGFLTKAALESDLDLQEDVVSWGPFWGCFESFFFALVLE